jgi:N-acetylglucosamine kinase-like BadF-type ATPase
MKYFLGIDGGGTKTVAVVADENGNIITTETTSSINYEVVGMFLAKQALKKLTEKLYSKTGIEKFDVAYVGCSAVAGRTDNELSQELFKDTVSADVCILDNDINIAFEGMRINGPCAIIINGTDSAVAGRYSDGTTIRKGGWGYILGSEGSGYAISVEAMRVALRAYDNAAPKTLLTDALLEYFDVNYPHELLNIFYRPAIRRTRIANFCKYVMECAKMDDAAAIDVIAEQCLLLSNTAAALLYEMPENTPLALWGGVMQNSEVYRDTIIALIHKRFPNILIDLPPYPPEVGAIFCAMKECSIEITDKILSNASLFKDDE